MNIREIRNKYPQYADMSDEEIARALHAKDYSDMDFGEFSSRIGLKKPQGGFSLKKTVQNIPSSAGQYAGDLWQAVSNPFQTISGLGQIGAGAIQMAIPGEQPYEGSARAAGQFYKDRYGGADQFLNTLQNDPVGVAADVSGLLTGAATAAPKTLGGLGKVGAAIDPLNMVTKPVRAVGKALTPKSLPENLTMGSAKFGTTYSPAERRSMARTMLDNDILPNQPGYDRLVALQEGLGSQIDTLIEKAQKSGASVPVETVARELPDLIRQAGAPTLTSADDIATITKVATDYLDEMRQRGVTRLTPKDLQDFKVNAYKQVNWQKLADPGKLTPAKEKAVTTMARTARREIEGLVPEVADVNRKYGQLAELREPLSRSVNRIDNRDLIGIGVPLKMAAGATVGGPAGGLLGNLAGFFDAPIPKAKLAQALEQLRVNPLLAQDAQYMALVRHLAAESGQVTPGLIQDDSYFSSRLAPGLLGR